MNRSGSKRIPEDFVPANSWLTFIKKISPSPYSTALYRCVCGIEKELGMGNVKRGKVISCGCFKSELVRKKMTRHGLTKHPLFRLFSYMKTRCYNKKSWAYPYYGGIGVKICDTWLRDFKAFYDWAISNGWKKGMSVDKDKIPKELGIPALLYSPEMCSILTHEENCNYKKSNHPVTLNGVTQNMAQWGRVLSISQDAIYSRLKAGWSEEKTLLMPVRKIKKWSV